MTDDERADIEYFRKKVLGVARPRVGSFMLYTSPSVGLCVLKLTKVVNNDLARYFIGENVITGKEETGGLYTDQDFERILKCPLTEMEVVAWSAKLST